MGYFNSTDESGLYSHFTGAVPSPTLLLYKDDEDERHEKLKTEISTLESQLETRERQLGESLKSIKRAVPSHDQIEGRGTRRNVGRNRVWAH